MKKLILAALLISAGIAHAEDNSTQAWEFRRKMCTFISKFAATAYARKAEGLAPQEISKEDYDINPLYDLSVWAVDYGRNKATDINDAARVGAAKCLDNIDDIYRDWRVGKRRDPKDYR